MRNFIILLFFASFASSIIYLGCEGNKKKSLIYLIDHTIYGHENMRRELEKEIRKYEDILNEKNYTKFKKIRSLKISYLSVDEKGGNSPKFCADIPTIPGNNYKEFGKAVEQLKKCFGDFKDIGKNPKQYKYTLYIDALRKALDVLKEDNIDEKNIAIIGDLAIVDKESCSLESRLGCSCKSYTRLKALKEKIKKTQNLNIKIIPVNIPGEESCFEKRQKIWDSLIGKK